MDFTKFRTTGELSDVEVCLTDHTFKLHRFPLYTKCDYFLEALSNKEGNASIKLENFPGGIDLFSSVADFCYNIHVDITFENVISLSCAADFLGMKGPGNLLEMTKFFLDSVLEKCKMMKELSPLVDIMISCTSLKEYKKAEEYFDMCLDCFCDCVSQDDLPSYSSVSHLGLPIDFNRAIPKLRQLHSDQFLKLVELLQQRQIHKETLAQIICSYLAIILQDYRKMTLKTESHEKGEAATTEDATESVLGESETKQIDEILSVIEDKNSISSFIPQTVITEALALIFKGKGESLEGFENKDFLVKVAASMIEKLPINFLLSLPLDLVLTITKIRCDGEKTTAEVVECVENYMQSAARSGKLQLSDFNDFHEVLQPSGKLNDGKLLEVVQELLETGNEITEEEKESLISKVNFEQVDEVGLRRAYDSAVVPLQSVAQAALTRCDKLRAQLADSKNVIQILEAEIRTLKTSPSPSSSSYSYSSLSSPSSSTSPSTTRYRSLYSRWGSTPYGGLW